jgi:hypothetical protein
VIQIPYEKIDDTINAISNILGDPLKVQNGRPIGIGAVSKLKIMGSGWILWTDHFRTPTHGTTVKAFLSFENHHQETLFRLKHPDLIK